MFEHTPVEFGIAAIKLNSLIKNDLSQIFAGENAFFWIVAVPKF